MPTETASNEKKNTANDVIAALHVSGTDVPVRSLRLAVTLRNHLYVLAVI